MIKKLFCAVGLVLCLGLFAGCKNNNTNESDNTVRYNAELNDNAIELIDETFADNNLVGGVYHEEFEGLEISLPYSRYFIVKDESESDEIFKENALDVDFETQMLVVYTFGIAQRLPAELYSVKLDDSTLNVIYKLKRIQGATTACQPFQRWFVVKLDTLDISSVTCSEIHYTLY